jgi:hypothetical protein
MIPFLILVCIFLIFGVLQNKDQRAFNNISDLLCTVKTHSSVHSFSFFAHYLRCAQNFGMIIHNFVSACMKNEPKNLGANRTPPLLFGSSSSQLLHVIKEDCLSKRKSSFYKKKFDYGQA